MRLTLRLSPSLQQTINERLEVELSGKTIGACIDYGKQHYPELESILYKDQQINPQILMFHNDTLIKEHNFSDSVKDGDVLDLIPAIEAG